MIANTAGILEASQPERRSQFSLVLATVGRTHEVERLLCSLDRQEGATFELIVVDQNTDDRLVPYLESRKNRYPIQHLRRDRCGASGARNIGLRYVSGDIVAFPDDDCWYPDGLLETVNRVIAQNPCWDGVTCMSRDAKGAVSNGRFAEDEGFVNFLAAWAQAIEYTMFFRRAVVDAVGPFDDELGVGGCTPFGSGEGTDYLLRVIGTGFRIYYRPALFVHHPNPYAVYDRRTIRKARSYGAGMGRVVRRHAYPVWFKLRMLARPLAGALLSVATLKPGKAMFHLSTFLGRLRGLLDPIT
ncbi:MAG: glycosyltransferase family 2 protein [Rhodospirillales bacterium]|nr:glycosyltransferase family 2 protein [Rhodospirillales bacterium]